MSDYDENSSHITALIDLLWSADREGHPSSVFAIVDGARDRRIEPLLNNSKEEVACLYSEIKTYALKRAAPHIVKLRHNSPFTRQLLSLAWGNSWGIFAVVPGKVEMRSLRFHCRRLAKVEAPGGKNMVFRYYDPRVLKPLLPVCNPAELQRIFGPVACFVMDSPTREVWLAHRQGDGNGEDAVQVSRAAPGMSLAGLGIETEQAPAMLNPLVLRKEHFEALERQAEIAYFREVRDLYLNNPTPDGNEQLRVAGNLVELKQFLLLCYQAAKQFELDTSASLLSFMRLNHRYGFEFWQQEPYRWVLALLKRERFANAKMEEIEQKMSARLMDQLWS